MEWISPKITKEKSARKAGYQTPRLDDSGDAVTPCCAFTNSKDHHDVQWINRIPSHTTMAYYVSARIRVGKLIWVGNPNPQPRDAKLTVWITACLGKGFFSRQASVGTAGEDAET